MTRRILALFAVAVVATAAVSGALATSPSQQTAWMVLPATSSQQSALLDEYCITCHEDALGEQRVVSAHHSDDEDVSTIHR